MNRNHPSRRRVKRKYSTPYAVIGAGPLTATIWKSGHEFSGWRYTFNVFRQSRRNGRVSQLYRPADLAHVIKLCQVVAMALTEDGCLDPVERQALAQLAAELAAVTRQRN